MAIVKQERGKGRSTLPVKYRDIERAYLNSHFSRYRFIVPNIHIGGWEADILAIRKSGFVDEIEIKVSRSDFLADFKKSVQVPNPNYDPNQSHFENMNAGQSKWIRIPKHEALDGGLIAPNYFSFLMPPDLVDQCVDDIPERFGLYEYAPELFYGNVRTIIKPKRLHSRKIDPAVELKMLRKVSWRYINKISDAAIDE